MVHVRFAPKADKKQVVSICLLSAITSARASSGSGNVIPSACGSFEVKYQLDLNGSLDRQISRFVTFEAELQGVVAPVCQMPRRRGEIIRPPLTRAYSRGRRFCAERCRYDCVNCIAGP